MNTALLKPIRTHWLADVNFLQSSVIYTPEEDEKLEDFQTLIDLCAKHKTMGNIGWRGQIVATRRAAYERSYPNAFAPLDQIQQGDVVDYMNNRRPLSALRDVRDEVCMPHDIESNCELYAAIFDNLYIQWHRHGDILDAALCGYFTGPKVIGGPVVLARWSTEDNPPSYEQMPAIVKARWSMKRQAPETYLFAPIGSALGALALLVAFGIALDILPDGEFDPNGFIRIATLLGGGMIGFAGAYWGRRVRKGLIRERFVRTYPTIAWAL